MSDPREEQQKALIKRITHSVGRFTEVMQTLNTEMDTIQTYHQDLKFVNSVWEGYHRKVAVMKQFDQQA
jgi:conjugal transfer/entry exclusion protein